MKVFFLAWRLWVFRSWFKCLVVRPLPMKQQSSKLPRYHHLSCNSCETHSGVLYLSDFMEDGEKEFTYENSEPQTIYLYLLCILFSFSTTSDALHVFLPRIPLYLPLTAAWPARFGVLILQGKMSNEQQQLSWFLHICALQLSSRLSNKVCALREDSWDWQFCTDLSRGMHWCPALLLN